MAASNVSFSSGNVYAQAVADRSDDTYVKFGLDTGTSPGESTIDFALYLAGGTLKVSENSNVTASLGTYQPGDVFKVAVESGVVKYYKNGTLFYTSTVAPSYPLYFNAITPEPDGRVVDARFGQGTGSPPSGSSTSSGVVYLHRDHLGSVSVATGATGVVVSSQEFDPWGKVRTGGVTQTKLNYTGQHRDDTGLLYYHARYYDPSLARFVSPDSIVPGAASGKGGAHGTVGAWQNSALTVDFHERGYVTSLQDENTSLLTEGFAFQGGVEPGTGPLNPQALARYAYVLNNPLKYTDPTRHNKADDLIDRGTEVPQQMRYPHKAAPNSVYYKVDPNTGRVTSYTVYGADGLPERFVEIGGRPHYIDGRYHEDHVRKYRRNTAPDGTVYPNTGPKDYEPAAPEDIPTKLAPRYRPVTKATGRRTSGKRRSHRSGTSAYIGGMDVGPGYADEAYVAGQQQEQSHGGLGALLAKPHYK